MLRIPIVLVAAGTAMLAFDAKGQDVDTRNWACELCAPSSGWELDLFAGPSFVANDEFHFGDYTGFEDSGFYLLADGFGRYWGEDAQFVRFEGYRLGLDSRALSVQAGKQGRYEVRASYREIPRRIFDTTRTPFLGTGSDQLRLPSDWVRAPSTQGMATLESSLEPVTIERDWNIFSAGVGITPSSRWEINLDYRRIKREGQDLFAGAFFFNAAEFTSPVDNVTNDVEASVAYDHEDWQLSFSYLGSFFDNHYDSVSWDNPYSAQTPGADTGRVALEPDNESHRFTIAGAWSLPRRTVVSGQLSLGHMNQDERLLPYTTNALVPTSLLPRTTADAKVDTTNLALRVTSSPVDKLSLDGSFGFARRDNETPEQTFDYVVTDLFNSATSATNIAYDYRRYDLGFSGHYRLASRTRLHAGYDFEDFRRDQQERENTRTHRIWARLNTRPVEIADLDAEVYHETRSGSDYQTIDEGVDSQNPLMRKYNMADRDRNGFRSFLSVYAGDRGDLGFEFEFNKDRYDETQIGLERSDYTRLGINGSFLLARDLSAYASLYYENVDSKQANSQTFSTPDWVASTDDDYYTSTVGVRAPEIVGRLGANLEYNYSRSSGEVSNDTSGLESQFPTLRSTLHQLKLGFDYQYTKAMSFKFGYLYERFKTNDWALNGVEPDTVPNLLSLGAEPYNYDNHVFFVGVRFLFDSRGQAGPRMTQY